MKTGFFSRHPRFTILCSVLLYALPIIFFFISYFLITTSGEDIWQGANNFRTGLTINPIDDAINAFNYNSRITDMYAWTVIDFFDYQFAFGPDIIFRLLDVAMTTGVFYLLTYFALGSRPKLRIRDAVTFCAIFLAVIITPFGRPFYHEFSMVHNYVPLALITLIFVFPYFNLLRGHNNRHPKLLSFGMLFLGLVFGMAATITPLAFILTAATYYIINHKKIKLRHLPLWFYTGILGTITGFAICWLAGSGIDHYTSETTAIAFDYIPFSEIFSRLNHLAYHEIYNFGITLIPLFGISLIAIIFSKKPKALFTKAFYHQLPAYTKKLLLVLIIFLVIHVLGASLVKSPPRLILPAYLAGIILIFHLFIPILKSSKILSAGIIILTISTISIHLIFRLQYHATTAEILKEIQNSPDSEICINRTRLNPPRLKIIDLSQANILVDWGEPQKIYQKSVTFCK